MNSQLPDQTDMRVLDLLQDDFPLTAFPYRELAEKAGISEQEFINRSSSLQKAGILRSISPVLESETLGMNAGTLIAFHLPEERIHEIAAVVNSFPEVTHNFIRDNYYSLWFTLIEKDLESLNKLLVKILEITGISEDDVLNLISVKKYKADVRFPL